MGKKRCKINKKTKNKKKTTFFDIIKKIFFWFLFFGFWVTTIWVLFFSSVMKIAEIEVEDILQEKQTIQTMVRNNISGKYFDFIPRDNLILFPEKRIEREISNKFMLIRKVKIEREFPTKIIVKIERRELSVVWCEDADCWLVDEYAEAFHQIVRQNLKEDDRSVVITDGSGKTVKKGDKVVDAKIIKLSSNLSEIIETESGVEIDQKSIYIPSPVSGELRAETKQGWKVYFSTERPVLIQAKILRKILNSKFIKEDIAELEYIDLRIKGKIIYRFKNYKERIKEAEELEFQSE